MEFKEDDFGNHKVFLKNVFYNKYLGVKVLRNVQASDVHNTDKQKRSLFLTDTMTE